MLVYLYVFYFFCDLLLCDVSVLDYYITNCIVDMYFLILCRYLVCLLSVIMLILCIHTLYNMISLLSMGASNRVCGGETLGD